MLFRYGGHWPTKGPGKTSVQTTIYSAPFDAIRGEVVLIPGGVNTNGPPPAPATSRCRNEDVASRQSVNAANTPLRSPNMSKLVTHAASGADCGKKAPVTAILRIRSSPATVHATT